MTPNDFFKDFRIGKLKIKTDIQAFYYHSAIGNTIDVYVINIDEDTAVSLLYIPTTNDMTGCFIFAKKATNGEFYEFTSKNPTDYYSNVGEFGGNGNERRKLQINLCNLSRSSRYKVLEIIKKIDFSTQLKEIGNSIIVGNYYFELCSGNIINVREFKK